MQTLITTTAPALGIVSTRSARVVRAEFEGGYSQRARRGPANIRREIEPEWRGIASAEMVAISDFLAARGGSEAFLWTPPGEATALKWSCKSWTVAELTRSTYTLSASFREEFDL
ncbi:MAG: phage tail protein [Pseudomonadota bacterium]